MPSFGASWIYLYGAPRSYKVIGDHDELNEGLGEGVAYRGRVLLAIQTMQLGEDDAATSSVKCMKLNSSQKLEVEKMPKKEFFFFATLMEATMINEEFKDKEISFEFSIG